MVIGLTYMSGVETDKEVLLACVLNIIEAVDADRDGDITREHTNESSKAIHLEEIEMNENKL